MVLPSVSRSRRGGGGGGWRNCLLRVSGLLLLLGLGFLLWAAGQQDPRGYFLFDEDPTTGGNNHNNLGLSLSLLLHRPEPNAVEVVASSVQPQQKLQPPPRDGVVSPQQHEQAVGGKEGGVVVIAHAVSLVTCKTGKTAQFLDALSVLRHAIHQTSIHNNNNHDQRSSSSSSSSSSASKYGYQMYAFVHRTGCPDPDLPPLLQRLGYIPKIVDTPVELNEIQGDGWYKSHVEGEKCCGIKEFIKLHAYTLMDHPISVHWDLDAIPLQPMDVLYDAMLYGPDTTIGSNARAQLEVQYHQRNQPLPHSIEAFFTRDVTSAAPWEPIQAVQGGFVVAKTIPQHLDLYRTLILSGNYTSGRGPGSGWGGLGYGGFQGAMAYQGALAYFYDVLYPGHHVELDVCRWNQVVADVVWRGPNGANHLHQCRDYPREGGDTPDYASNTLANGKCEDCRILPVNQTRTVHYTACHKPWECALPHPRIPGPARKAHTYRLQELTNVTTCGLLFREYFALRHDLERQIAVAIASAHNKEAPPSLSMTPVDPTGYHPEYFLGYCTRQGGYRTMDPLPDGFDLKQVYGF